MASAILGAPGLAETAMDLIVVEAKQTLHALEAKLVVPTVAREAEFVRRVVQAAVV